MSRNGKNNKGGRPVGSKLAKTIRAENARKYVTDRITEELEPIVSAQIDAAKGMRIIDKDGRIYTRAPELKTGEYLINQGAGRPTEQIELSGRDGAPLIIPLDEQ